MTSSSRAKNDDAPLLLLAHLPVGFKGQPNVVVYGDVSREVKRGEALCVVDGSGFAKSVTALAIMGLLPKYTANFSSVKLEFESELFAPAEQIIPASQRKNRLAKIFQEPMTSLDPSCTIVNQISETVLCHQGGSKADARARRLSMLERMGMENSETRLSEDPYQSSGGTRQQAMIAASLAEIANALRIEKGGASHSRAMEVSQ